MLIVIPDSVYIKDSFILEYNYNYIMIEVVPLYTPAMQSFLWIIYYCCCCCCYCYYCCCYCYSCIRLSTEESSSLELVPVLPRNNVSSSKEKTAQSVKVVSVTSPVDSNNNDPNNNNNNNPNNNNNSSRPNKENSEPNIISVIPLVREDDDSPWDRY